MQSSNAPIKIALPFANTSGARRAIPTASQIGITPGAASLTDGFPPLTRTALSSGGVPPSGLDMNGVLYLLSASDQWVQAGGQPTYDSTFSTAIGGYPLGAVLKSADGLTWWRSTAENNTNNPDTGGANWVSDTVLLSVSGDGTPSMDGTAARGSSTHGARADHVHPTDSSRAPLASPTFTGTPVVPGYLTTAAAASTYAPLASPTLTGTPAVPTASPGTNTTQAASTAFVQAAVSAASSGQLQKVGNKYVGDYSAGVNDTGSVTFSSAFPTACNFVTVTAEDPTGASTQITVVSRSASGFSYALHEQSATVENLTIVWQAFGT